MKKLLAGIGALGLMIALSPMISAFEAHVINVTATIANGLEVPIEEIDFGTVFPQEKLDKEFNVSLSDSFLETVQNPVNLLVNGGFETPVVATSEKWNIYPSGTAGLGWTVEWEPGQLTTHNSQNRPETARLELHQSGIVAGWLSQEGNQYAELDTDWDGPGQPLNNEPALVKIYQDIATIPGVEYTLSYYYSPRPSTPGSDNTLMVRVDGSQVALHGPTPGVGGTAWTLYTYVFNATLPTTRIEFGAGGTANSLGVFLDNVSLMNTSEGTITYILRQKPKCVSNTDANVHPQVTEDGEGNFVCPNESTMMPLLCPYLSKHEITDDPGQGQENDGAGINAFHGLPGPWVLQTTLDTQVNGELSAVSEDESDTWNIDLKVPCFGGHCAQDWADFVHEFAPGANPNDYIQPANLEHEIFGCDLWLEVTSLN